MAHRSYQTHDKCLWNVVPLNCECPLKLINRFREINLNGIRYRDEILAPIVLPFIRTHHFNHFFRQDNARCHISRVAMNFLNDNHIRTLPWPALSPDLNPIEHLWDELGRRVRMRVNLPESIDQFQRALTVEWEPKFRHDNECHLSFQPPF
jgi:transposase